MALIGNCIVCIKASSKVMNLILRMKFDFFSSKVMLPEPPSIMVKKIYQDQSYIKYVLKLYTNKHSDH